MKKEDARKHLDRIKKDREAVVKQKKVVKKDEHPRTERQ